MKPVVAIIAQGAMGAGVAARLTQHGVTVLTSLQGRGKASIERAKAAGMQDASDDDIAAADIVLSIVPPRDAMALAERLAPHLTKASKKPVYVDCNAVSPQTVIEIGAVIDKTGAAFIDAGIIGSPPKKGDRGPAFYYSGGQSPIIDQLNDSGLFFRPLDSAVGAASALKMSYAGITKGLTAIGSAMIVSAQRAGAGEALRAELADSQPMLLNYFTRSVPGMFPKASRWVAEMQEIASFHREGPAQDMYQAIAALYQQLATDEAGDRTDINTLSAFFEKPAK